MSSTQTLRGFATLNIWADDVPAAARWYADFLGVEPYFDRSGPDGRPAYIEFRLGDRQAELGIISTAFAPPGMVTGAPAGAGVMMHWHVDDLEGTLERLLALGAKEHRPPVEHGEGFRTASVIDPFGNVLGIMYNAHYLEMLAARG